MRYYAVTDDPNELLHYGVKGMKWGQHIFGDKPKSPGYRRALGKLRDSFNRSRTQRAINKQRKQEEKYNAAVQKAQQRIQATESLYNFDRIQSYTNRSNQINRQETRAAKAASRRERKYARNELKMDKYLQQARQGKLKYGKLSDDQVRQITDRLAMERSARSLGSAEKTWRQQKKEAFRKGALSGIERGTAASMEEIAKAGTIYGIQNFMNRRKRNAMAKQQGKENKIRTKEQNKKTHKEMRKELRDEMYEQALEAGESAWQRRRRLTAKGAATKLQDIEKNQHEKLRARAIEDRIQNEKDIEGNAEYQKLLSKQRERKRLEDAQDRAAANIEDRWQRYLDSEGKTDLEARLAGGYDNLQIERANNDRSRANDQRRRIMAEAESKKNESAYSVAVQEAQRRIENEAIEARNEKREEQYNKDMEEYKKDKEYNRQLKEQYDAEMDKYNDYVRRNIAAIKPAVPKYKTPIKPIRADYGFEDLNDTSKLPTTYKEFERMRDITGFNPFNTNNGKKPKKGGKK